MIILLFILLSAVAYSEKLYETSALIGFQNIYLRGSLSQTMDKLNKMELNYRSENLEIQKTEMNPYLLLNKHFHYETRTDSPARNRFNYHYTPSALAFNINNSTYYLTLISLSIRHPSYVYHEKEKQFYLKFLGLKILRISNKNHLLLLNKLLTDISFHFYKDQLYETRYGLSLNIHQVKRLMNNFRSKYGWYRIKKTSSGLKKKFNIWWEFKDVTVSLSLDKSSFIAMNNIDEAQEKEELDANHIVRISLTYKPMKRDIEKHKSLIYKDLLDNLKHETENRLRKLRENIRLARDKTKRMRRMKSHKKYRDVDNL